MDRTNPHQKLIDDINRAAEYLHAHPEVSNTYQAATARFFAAIQAAEGLPSMHTFLNNNPPARLRPSGGKLVRSFDAPVK